MILVRNVETDEEVSFTPNDLLDDINRDRSESWTDYTLQDICTTQGLLDALTMTEYELVEWDEEELEKIHRLG